MSRSFLTFQIYFAIICLGLSGAVLGPTLIAIGNQIDVKDVGNLSFLFVTRAAMYLLGSIFSGYIASKYKCGFHFLTGVMFYAAAILATLPYIRSASFMYFAISMHGLANGALTNLPNSFILRLFEDSPNQGMYMQGLHFFFGVGATAAPLLVRLLIPTNIMNVYLFISLFHVICGLFMTGTIISRSFIHLESENDVDNEAKKLLTTSSTQERIPKRVTFGRREIAFVILMSLFIMCYVGQEVGVGALLYSFGRLSDFDMSSSDAAMLTTSFWLSFTIGRFVAIFASKCMRPVTLLSYSILGVFLGTIILHESSLHTNNENPDVIRRASTLLWLAVSMLGFTNAPIYASAVTLTDEYIETNENVVSALVAGDTVGEMIIPGMIGQFMSHFGPGSFSVGVAIPVMCSSIIFLIIRSAFSPRHRLPAYSL